MFPSTHRIWRVTILHKILKKYVRFCMGHIGFCSGSILSYWNFCTKRIFDAVVAPRGVLLPRESCARRPSRRAARGWDLPARPARPLRVGLSGSPPERQASSPEAAPDLSWHCGIALHSCCSVKAKTIKSWWRSLYCDPSAIDTTELLKRWFLLFKLLKWIEMT